MSVNREDIEYTLELAKLSVEEDKVNGFIDDINKILEYVDDLKELDTENVEVLINPYEYENVFREDDIEASLSIKEVFLNSENRFDNYFVVPRVIE